MSAYQRLFGYDRSEPVQVEAFKNHKSNHGGLLVLISRVRCPLRVHQADGGVGAGIPLKAGHWSIIHPGTTEEKKASIKTCLCIPCAFLIHSSSQSSTPDYDVILIDVRSEVAAVKDPSVAHHHAPPASASSAQGWRQARLG